MWVLLLIGAVEWTDIPPPQMILTFNTYDECIEAEMQDHIYDNIVYYVEESCQEF
jgi:hypothetical protein